jgi:hypothetical protein
MAVQGWVVGGRWGIMTTKRELKLPHKLHYTLLLLQQAQLGLRKVHSNSAAWLLLPLLRADCKATVQGDGPPVGNLLHMQGQLASCWGLACMEPTHPIGRGTWS